MSDKTMVPDLHHLNKILADVAGVKIIDHIDGNLWLFQADRIWSPTTDPVQMEQVKAALREQGWGYASSWYQDIGTYLGLIQRGPRDQQGSLVEVWSTDSELIALAMAIDEAWKAR